MALGSPTGSAAPLDDERLRRLAAYAAVGLFEADCHGVLTFVTPKWREVTHLQTCTAFETTWLESVDPQDRERVTGAWNNAVTAGVALDVRYRAAFDGTTVLRAMLEPVMDSAGTVNQYAGTTFVASPLLDRLAEAMPQLVWVSASDGTIEHFNRAWIEYTGVTTADLQRGGPIGVVHPDDLDRTWEQWKRALAAGDSYEIEYRLRCASDGSYRWFLARATPVRDENGHIVNWVGTATDIDSQKRANANLRFVLEAGVALAATYDVAAICNDLACLAVHRIADWCFITLADSRSRHKIAAIAHHDPERVRALERFRTGPPLRLGGALDAAMRRNIPVLLPSVTAQHLEEAASDPEQRAALASLGLQSAMIVPLSTADGNTYGAITLASSESGHSFTHEDLEVVEMVAQRAAAAIQTATVFSEERRRSGELRFIADASEIIFESLDLQRIFDRLCKFIAKEAADFALVTLVEDGEALRTVSVAHRDRAMQAKAERLRGQRVLRPAAEETAVRDLATHRTMLRTALTADDVLMSNTWEYLASDIRALDVRSGIVIPLHSRGETFGAVGVYRCGPSAKPYDERDLPMFSDIGRRLSIAIDHSGTLQRERKIAEALQQTLLPQPGSMPNGDGIKFATEYRPSSHEADVGGDWYDALRLQDGSIAVSVGDVTGRGLAAAGLMGKLRQAMSMALMYESDPARILDAADAQLRLRGSHSIATAFIGIIDSKRKTMRYASAGHPPPLLRRSDDLIELRSGGLPLGLRDADREESQSVSLDGAQLLVLYTDGLTEATRDVAFGEQRLQQVANSEAILYVRNAARFVCDACLPHNAQDDTAVLTVSFGERSHWTFDAENAQSAHDARSQYVERLREGATPDSDIDAAELIFGELVGNVVRHAPGPIDVQLEWEHGEAVVHVTDRGKGFIRNPALPVDPLSESGRGLYIISLLAANVRVERIPGYGNHIAVVLPVRALAEQRNTG